MTRNKHLTYGSIVLAILGVIIIGGCAKRSDVQVQRIEKILASQNFYINKTVSFEGYVYGISSSIGNPANPSAYQASVWDINPNLFPTGSYGKIDQLRKHNMLDVIIHGDSEVVDGQKVSIKGIGVIKCPLLDVRATASSQKSFCIEALAEDVIIYNQTELQKQKALCRNSLSQINEPQFDEISCSNLENSTLEECTIDTDCGLSATNYPICGKGGLTEENHSMQGYNNNRQETSSCRCADNVCRFILNKK